MAQVHSHLCRITCTDQSTYVLRACVIGWIVEVNLRLLQEPGLLTASPAGEGFVAIVQQERGLSARRRQHMISHLLTSDQYAAHRGPPRIDPVVDAEPAATDILVAVTAVDAGAGHEGNVH